METDPSKMLKDASTDNGDLLQRDFMKFVSIMESEGKKRAYIARYEKVIHSWTKFNAIRFRLIANIENENINENVQDEKVPTNEELGKILRKAGLRERVSISHGILRNQTSGIRQQRGQRWPEIERYC